MNQSIQELKSQVERVLHWEQSSHWRLRDFALLSEQVLAHTDCWVEAHDLELFWRSSEATPGLLDALAKFVDYTDWTDFRARNQLSEMVPIKPDLFHTRSWEIPIRWVIVLYGIAILASILLAILLVWKR